MCGVVSLLDQDANCHIMMQQAAGTNIVPSVISLLASEIRAETSEKLWELKFMFAYPKHGPLHNGRTCVQCIPWMPAEEVPYQSFQLF